MLSISPKVESKTLSCRKTHPARIFYIDSQGKGPSEEKAEAGKGKGSRSSGFSSEDTVGERRRNGED